MEQAPRLQKILALLDSPHEGEAISALLALRQHLAAQNLRLADFFADPDSALLAANEQLRQQLESSRSATAASQQARQRDMASAEKWRTLAQKTADQLWEIGQQLHTMDEPVTAAPYLHTVRR